VREWVESEAAHTHAVKFTLLTDRHRRAIRAYVEHRAPH